MKKIASIVMASAVALSLAACSGTGNTADSTAATGTTTGLTTGDSSAQESSEGEAKTAVTIKILNGNREKIQLEVPYDPQRIAVMDLAALDMIDNFGYGDRVVGVSKGSSIEYLQKYMDDDSIANLGTIKEASMEALMECEPDLIFIGGRLSGSYDEFTKIAPVVFLTTDVEIGVVNSVKENAMTVASLFGEEDKVTGMLADFDARIEKLAAFSEGKTAFVGMLNAGGFNVLGNDGRCSLIGVEAGFDNIGLGAEKGESKEGSGESTITSTHGNETSFEYIVRLDPDYMFVMNRDAAIGTDGAQAAEEVIENDLVKKTSAYQNDNIVYLKYSNIWYTAEGGITALDYMLKDLESSLLK